MNSSKQKKMFLLFSHILTHKQEEEARISLGVTEFISLPPELQELWSNIPPDLASIDDLIEVFKHWIGENARAGDVALIQGDFGLTYAMVNFCKEKGIIAIYATTERKVEEEKKDDVTLIKRSFRHVRFRLY